LFLVACERGLFDDVRVSFRRIAFVQTTFEGYYALQVKELIHRGVDLDIKDSFGRSGLHLAAARGRAEIAQHLWSKNVDLENEDKGM
jgi:ankyrin repeat protein